MTIESFEHKGFTVEIDADECPSPREWDNLSTMVCFHSRYNLGDKNHGYNSKDFTGWEALQTQIEKDHRPVVILPLYLFDHSGITISTDASRFRACDSHGWDWGQIGFVFVSREKAPLLCRSLLSLKEYGAKIITPKIRELAEQVLLGEVETYDQFLRGEVYCFTITDGDGNMVDTLSGIYGFDYAKEEAMKEVELAIQEAARDAAAEEEAKAESDSLFIFSVEHTIVANNEQEARRKLQEHLDQCHRGRLILEGDWSLKAADHPASKSQGYARV